MTAIIKEVGINEKTFQLELPKKLSAQFEQPFQYVYSHLNHKIVFKSNGFEKQKVSLYDV